MESLRKWPKRAEQGNTLGLGPPHARLDQIQAQDLHAKSSLLFGTQHQCCTDNTSFPRAMIYPLSALTAGSVDRWLAGA